LDISVTNQSKTEADLDRLKRLAEFVLDREKADAESEVGVALVDLDKIRELNLRYRQIDSPTDVLSFDLSDENKLSGEVVISPDIASENASEEEISISEEIEALLVHGILHLLGYSHDSEDDSEAMLNRHDQIYREFAGSEEADGR
jgi:probable rRNA maturation factor